MLPEERQLLIESSKTKTASELAVAPPQGSLDTSVLLRKGIYDKVAAQVILQRYLDFYNSEDEQIVVEPVR